MSQFLLPFRVLRRWAIGANRSIVRGRHGRTAEQPGSRRDIQDESDDALAARALHDPEAFTLLYRAYALDVYRYCYRRLQDREAAEDATSQTFVNAYSGLRRLGDKPFRPWLFAIAHNVVVDIHRDRRPLSPSTRRTPAKIPIHPRRRWRSTMSNETTMQLLLASSPSGTGRSSSCGWPG